MRNSKIKIIRTSTIALSLDILLKGQLKYLNQFYRVKAISGNDERLKKVKERENIEVIPLKMERKISLVNDMISLIKMYIILRKEKPYIVHSITPKAGLITMIAAKLAGVPIRMHTFTGLIFPYATGYMKKLLILMDRLLCMSATHVYPEGNGVKNDLITYNITKKPLKVLANGNINGIDIDFFKPNTVNKEDLLHIKNKYNIKEEHFIFCFVGRIVLEKGIRELFTAFEALYEKNPTIRLLLVGELDDSEENNQKIHSSILKHEGIIFTGWQNDIKPFLSISHCFVFPSYREGFPNVILQACAMQLPCIVSNINGSNEIIQHLENGIIVPVKNIDLLKEAMQTLLHNSDLRDTLAHSARKTIIDKFEQSKVWKALHEEYENNIAEHKKKKLIRITTVPISMDKLLEGQLKYMRNFYHVTAISSDEKGYLQKIAKRENVDFHPIVITRKITLVRDLYALLKLWFFFKKTKPDIVHTHTPKAGTLGMWAAYLAKVPIRIHTVAGLPLMEYSGLKKFFISYIEKLTYASANYILPNSYGLKTYILEQQYTKPEKVQVIANGSSNGINVDFFNPTLFTDDDKEKLKQKLNISKNDFVYIFVGRVVGDKGINELISAFKAITHENKKLLLVGKLEGKLDPLKAETFQEINSNPNIIMTGWQNDVRKYFAISHVLVFPSYREGLPNVVMQAGAMEIPSIVTDITGSNEIITHHKNGLVIPVKDSSSLKTAMELIFNNEELYSQLQKNARAEISNKYNQQYLWGQLHEFYENALIGQNNN